MSLTNSLRTLLSDAVTLYFAAHGFLNEVEPSLTSIVLGQVNRAPGTDGYVTLTELASLELRSDLVVVSAREW